ncbi:MAG TPA: NAD-binding protein [Salinivirga sp.]|uniref:potassium channel family protein n=1 Tax=Salinivirga sp. TaxID=1970192 RepID=UPI002B461BE1|nr:NAD-binding protein [Salinivirga sp.]HKK58925.1 NAD-binding protein [Salinivirga sp.]
MKSGQHNIRIALALLMSIMALGIIGYMTIEGFTFVEAIYMTVITVSTVGFKEVHDMDPAGQIFTSFLIILSFGLFAYALSTLTRFLFDGKFRNYYIDYKMRIRVAKMQNHVVVFGWGRTGGRAVEELKRHNTPFVIVEKKEDRISEIRGQKTGPYIYESGTADEALIQAGINKAKALITTLPNDAANLMIIITARKINHKVRIISRAVRENSDLKLRRAGADNVIMSDRMGGSRMAKNVTQPVALKFIDRLLDQKANVHLEQIYCTDLSQCFLNKSIRAMNVGATTGANIIGMRKEDGSIIFNPAADVILNCSDRLFVMGTSSQIQHLKKVLFGKED